MASKVPRITANRGNSQNSAKKINLSSFKANSPKPSRKNSISEIYSYYKDIPNSEIDEILYVDNSEPNDQFYIKFTDTSFHEPKLIFRNEFKDYTNGEQIYSYFSDLSFRHSLNPLFLKEEKILKTLTKNGKTIYLIKWFNLPVKYSTWEETATEFIIKNFEREHIHLYPSMDSDFESIIGHIPLNFPPAQSTVIHSMIKTFFDDNYYQIALLGGIGSIMRKEVMIAAKLIREISYCNLPILFIVDEDLVPIVKTELQVNLGLITLQINFDMNEINAIHENGWFYPGTSFTNYTAIVISYEALPFMMDLLKKTEFLVVCADATSNKTCLNTISNLLSDFVQGEEMTKPTDEKSQLELIEDYLKTSDLKAKLVISLLPFFLHRPTNERFLDSYCEPSRLCQEEFLLCKLTPEQRTKYDNFIYENMNFEDLNHLCGQDLIDQLNLICDHPSFVDNNYDSSSQIQEKMALHSGKLSVLCDMIDKAIYGEKRTLIITSNHLLFELLQQYFHFIEKPVEILDKDNLHGQKKFQFVLCHMSHTDLIPWCSLELDWIFCLTPYINPIKHSSNWEHVLQNHFILQKCTIFRFVIEDTHEVYLAQDEISSDINERPDIPYHILLSYAYPIRLLAERSRSKPFIIRIHHQATPIYMQEMAINSAAANASINSNEMNCFVGDFEPCMLESVRGLFVPTSTLITKDNRIKITLKLKSAKDDAEKVNDSKENFKTHFLQYADKKEQLESALEIDYSDFNEDWSPSTIEILLHIISSVCWGNWESMASKMPFLVSPGTTKQAAYLLLDSMLKSTDREYKIAATFKSKFESELDAKSSKILLDNINEFMRLYASNDSNDLNCRLDRIEDLMVVTMVLARSNVNNLPHEIYIPRHFYDSIPGPEWTEANDREMLYMVYSNGYNEFSTNALTHGSFASLSCRFHALIQAYIPEIPSITGCISQPVSSSIPLTPQSPKVKSPIRISLKGPKSNTPKTKEKKAVIWTNDEKKQFAQLIIDYGPNLGVNDFRSLFPLDGKSDQDIISLKTKIIDYGNNKSNAFESLIGREILASSLSFYNDLDQLNVDDFYYEDQAIIAAITFWGLKNCSKSPVLRNLFDYVSEKAIRNELIKLKKRTISDQTILKIKEKGLDHLNSFDHEFIYDTIDGRSISKKPIGVAKGISIISLGHIKLHASYSNAHYIYPEGYSVNCFYNNYNVTCNIQDNGHNEPLFSVSLNNKTFSGRTPEEAWLLFMNNEMHLPQYSFDLWRVPGHELFGLTSPLTKRLIQTLPSASDCTYVPQFFRTLIEEIEHILEPKEQNKTEIDDIGTLPIKLSQFYPVNQPSKQKEEKTEPQRKETPVTTRPGGKRGNITIRPSIPFKNPIKSYLVKKSSDSDDNDANDGGAFVDDTISYSPDELSTTTMQTRDKKEKSSEMNELVQRPNIKTYRLAPFERNKDGVPKKDNENESSIQRPEYLKRRKRHRLFSETTKIGDTNIQADNSQAAKPKVKSELRFPFYKVMNKVGSESNQMSFDAKLMFSNLNPLIQPENYKRELKQLGNNLLAQAEVQSIFGLNDTPGRSSTATTANVTDSEI